jgi:hypothetical protein
MASASSSYRPRAPEQGVLFEVVRDHFETFRSQAATLRDGHGLPQFVDGEFRAFLRCGVLAGGFARLHCGSCGLGHLVPFSCKGRGFCPSCGERRMAERAAHLVDQVFPEVPIRQWVLTVPHRLRYLLAWDHDLCRAVVRVFLRAVMGVSVASDAERVSPAGGRAPWRSSSASENGSSVNQTPLVFPIVPCRGAHLVLDDVRLVLHDLDAGARGRVDHLQGHREAPAMIDADFGDDERHVGGTNGTMGDVDFGPRHSSNCT